MYPPEIRSEMVHYPSQDGTQITCPLLALFGEEDPNPSPAHASRRSPEKAIEQPCRRQQTALTTSS